MGPDRPRWETLIWTRRGQGSLADRSLRSPLWLASGLYGAAMKARARAYGAGWLGAHKVDARVIVVGNLTVGGTGKTPVTQWIARGIKDRGARPAVVLRGYGGALGPGPLVVSEGDGALTGPERAGDEAVLLAGKLAGIPVVAFPDRVRAARLAITRFGADHVVLDDGYQHLRLARDVNVLVADARDDPAGHYLLPRGPLREPLEAAARARAVVVSRSRDGRPPAWPWLSRYCPDAPVFPMRYRIEVSPGPALAFCGIGSPEGFFEGLAGAGVEVAARAVFSDHHFYREAELAELAARARAAGAARLVTTEKDAVKIAPEWARDFPLEAARVELDFFGAGDRLMELVMARER